MIFNLWFRGSSSPTQLVVEDCSLVCVRGRLTKGSDCLLHRFFWGDESDGVSPVVMETVTDSARFREVSLMSEDAPQVLFDVVFLEVRDASRFMAFSTED